MKLRREDLREKSTNVITNNQDDKSVWLDSFGGQKDLYHDKFNQTINKIHTDKDQIASAMTNADRDNEKLRVNIQY